MRRYIVTLAGIGVLLTLTALAQAPSADTQREHQHAGVVEQSAEPAALRSSLGGIVVDFALPDATGRVISDEDFRGRYLLVAFGFTHCPDVCPLMAFNMASVLRATTHDAAGVFISVDTERDTPAITERYARSFDARMTGLSGTYEQINEAARNFRASYAVTKTQSGYTVQHTSHVYLIDPDGALVDVFAYTTPAAEIAAAIE